MINNNEENIKNKISLDNKLPKTDTSDILPQSEDQNIPSASKSSPEPSTMENYEGLELKPKAPGIKLPETKKENISTQDVKLKLKPIKSASDITDKKNVLTQTPKSNDQIPPTSNVPTEPGGEQSSLTFVDIQKEKKTNSVISLDKINIKPEKILEKEEHPAKEEEESKISFNDFTVLSSTGFEEEHISDTLRLRLKPKTSSSSAFNNLTSEEKAEVNIPAKENNGKEYDSIGNITNSTTKSAKDNIKYFYIVGALVIIIIFSYFLISTIKILMTI